MTSYAAAVATAVVNAASNVLNRKAARDEPAAFQLRLTLIADLLRRRAGRRGADERAPLSG